MLLQEALLSIVFSIYVGNLMHLFGSETYERMSVETPDLVRIPFELTRLTIKGDELW